MLDLDRMTATAIQRNPIRFSHMSLRIGLAGVGKRAVTADSDLRLGRFFGLSDGRWLRLQAAYDTEVAKASLAKALAMNPASLSLGGRSPKQSRRGDLDRHGGLAAASRGRVENLPHSRVLRRLGHGPCAVSGLPKRAARKDHTLERVGRAGRRYPWTRPFPLAGTSQINCFDGSLMSGRELTGGMRVAVTGGARQE
jgi:hypothetical protein